MVSMILQIKDLSITFTSRHGKAKAVNNLNFELKQGETLGIVGESGCGKSATSLAIMRLLDAEISGHIFFNGEDLMSKTEDEMCQIRGNEISMVFQEPMTALNPVFTIGNQLRETIMAHQNVSKKEGMQKAIELLKLVGIPSPEKRIHQYPHELSGGMRQRVMIAIALSCNPKLLIADEPTTALDVTIQAQILELMKKMKEQISASIIIISHDLGVIADMANKVMVMYAGSVVEYSDVHSLYEDPLHPYTQGLLDSIPSLQKDQDKLNAIPGMVPSIFDLPKGCKFSTRCKYKTDICDQEPDLIEVKGRQVKCWMYSEEWKANDNG